MIDLFIQGTIGLLAGLLGGLLGVGGSTIIIPAFILYLSQTPEGYRGEDQHKLQAAAMICNVFIAGSSILSHVRAKAVIGPVAWRLIVSAIIGILGGVSLSNSFLFARENGRYLAMGLAGFLGYVALYNLWKYRADLTCKNAFHPEEDIPLYPLRTLLVGGAMGFVAGLLGIGGGALCVPAQLMFLRIPLRRAIANSALTIVCVSGFGAFYKNATLPMHGFAVSESIRLAIAIIPTAMIGSYIGGRLTHTLPRNVLRIAFILFTITVALLTLSKALGAK